MELGKFAPSPFPPVWTDEQLDRLSQLWADGLSATEIFPKLNSEFGTIFTRSAVLGKVHRANLPMRVDRPQGSGLKPRVRAHHAAPAPEIADELIPFEQRRTLLELNEHTCRWPVGEPREPGFFFCGGPVVEGPYCPGHARRAFNG